MTAATDPAVPRQRTGRPPLTSRAELLAAARDVGFEQLTVGAVTSRCGVKYSTFYRHFESLDDLTSTLADDVLGEVPWPQPGPWRQHLEALSVEVANVLTRWPGLAEHLPTRVQQPPPLAAARKRAAEVLVADGFGAPDAWVGADAVLHATIGRSRLHDSGTLDQRVALVLDGLAARRWET